MEQTAGLANLDARTLKHIRVTATHVARCNRIPGMDREDIEQDLILDLWHRRQSFDPSRASFPTFADRIIAHRVATLTSPTIRLRAEREMAWIEAPLLDDDSKTLADTLPDPRSPDDLEWGLAFDVRRFLSALSPALRRCCDILVLPNIAHASRLAGLHRSSVYEGAARLRALATSAGLHDYLSPSRQIGTPAGK